MSNYRNADARTQWYEDNYPGSVMNLNSKTMVLTLHTTEGYSWPGYEGGAMAPNYTGHPPNATKGSGHWRAHFPDERSSRALVHLGWPATNTLNTVQVELVGTCDPAHRIHWGAGLRAGRDYVYWPHATKAQLRWLARFVADMHIRHGLQLVAPRRFKGYPGSYGKANGVRLTGAEWTHTVGIVGHQHVPENVHGDPGEIDIAYVIKWAKRYVALYNLRHPGNKK